MFENIPQELRALPQWVVWRYEDKQAEKPTKVPYSPRHAYAQLHASVNKPETWGTYEEALGALALGYDGIGFVFTQHDPYGVIDLDDAKGDSVTIARQTKIFHEFNSYSEQSPSGQGLHIILKGAIPSGRKRSNVEIYSWGRFITMTGRVYNNVPIQDRQQLLTQLYNQMSEGGIKANTLYRGTQHEKYADEKILEMAYGAHNGAKFADLFSGQWQQHYSSQSEADFALIDIIAFYSEHAGQIVRLFRKSALGQRDKAQRDDYVSRMVEASFDRMLPPLDLEGFANKINDTVQTQQPQIDAPQYPSQSDLFGADTIETAMPNPAVGSIPPGLLGQIAQFIYQQSPRQVPEAALAGAIALMAGIAGRAYNISGTGLNQYVIYVTPTGNGKEAIPSGIEKLMLHIKHQVVASSSFIGPAEISSGQALIKYLNESPCFVSMLGEMGLRIQELSSQHASPVQKMFRRMIMDLYHKSGYGQQLRPSVYSDKDKNTSVVERPSFSIVGDTTPENFYGHLDEHMIAEGLLPRFSIIEYNGPRPPMNKGHETVQPTFELVDKLSQLAAHALSIMQQGKVINISQREDAAHLLDEFDRYCDNRINSAGRDAVKSIWNRAHIKALKLAALLAVGIDPYNPVVTSENARWAIDLVSHDIKTIQMRFDTGQVGSNNLEIKQADEVTRVVKEYYRLDRNAVMKYLTGQSVHMYEQRIIPLAYIQRRTQALACFRADRAGAANALKRVIQQLLETDKLREINRGELVTKFATTQRAFIVSNVALLE